MKVISFSVENFGSYKQLSFDVSNLGLSLVYGPTGSGKSTLQDIIPWILFGVTSKGGSVDEICSWTAKGEATVGTLLVDTSKGLVNITRIRGKAKQNDLYWIAPNSHNKIIRGKDLTDTQRLLEEFLAVSRDTYCTATYFNEFSESGLFFLSKAKEKRELLEKIACLDLPITLGEKSSFIKRSIKKDIEKINNSLSFTKGKLDQLKLTKDSLLNNKNQWDSDQQNIIKELEVKSKYFQKEKDSKIEELESKSYRFEMDKNKKIEDLVDRLDDLDQKINSIENFDELIEEEKRKMRLLNPNCPTCKRPVKTNKELERLEKDKAANIQYKEKFSEVSEKIKEIQKTKNPYKDIIEQVILSNNHYASQLGAQRTQINPFLRSLEETNKTESSLVLKQKQIESELEVLSYKYRSLDQLYDLSFELRGKLLTKVVKEVQDDINKYLENYFDSEFKVLFELQNADELSVDIYKNGNPCVFTQLSKGQRQILKLCFAVAIMKATSNNAGIKFNLLSFDEALDGMDSELKTKAFYLFAELEKSYETILLIEHSPEFQSMFSNKYKVFIENDESHLVHE